jgi:5-methylcytosine-specific restriction endonuclease McrA
MIAGKSSALNANVLVLNKYYSAIHVLTARKAFCLLCKGAAEVVNVEDGAFMTYDFDGWLEQSELRQELNDVDPDDEYVQAVNFTIQVPRIIRLIRYDRIPRNIVKFNRRNVFLRDNHQCQYCGETFPHSSLSLDHVMPRSRGGETSWENIVSACLKCNVRKGGRTPQEANMSLTSRPSKPVRNPALDRQLAQRKYESWKTFL